MLDFFFFFFGYLFEGEGNRIRGIQCAAQGEVVIRLTPGFCLELLIDYGCCAMLSLSVVSDSLQSHGL